MFSGISNYVLVIDHLLLIISVWSELTLSNDFVEYR